MALWPAKKWKRLEAWLFDVSEYMRNVQAAFARWYNRRAGRKGRFWAERFKATLLAGPEAVLECLRYVELNPLRAGLVAKPEEWEASSEEGAPHAPRDAVVNLDLALVYRLPAGPHGPSSVCYFML